MQASPPHPRENKGRKLCVTSQKRLLKNQKSEKSQETFGPISGPTIPFIRFKATKLRNLLGFSDIENLLKDQLFETSGFQFDNWGLRPEKFSRLLRHSPKVSCPAVDCDESLNEERAKYTYTRETQRSRHAS